MFTKWSLLKFLLRRAARTHRILDPLTFMAQMRRFAQPSEVSEPIELLREGIKFHARGLLNTKAIQHNLDWVWPYWIERQFNPKDPSFIPRAFSFSHINLTHRSWTAVGLPNQSNYPIVDPRGLVTPLTNGWSIDFWIWSLDGGRLLPSRAPAATQDLRLNDRLTVTTRVTAGGLRLTTAVWMEVDEGVPHLFIHARGAAPGGGMLVASLRPYNPEGIQFVETIRYEPQKPGWRINDRDLVVMTDPPEETAYSNYAEGDVAAAATGGDDQDGISCTVGMATAAAFFSIPPDGVRRVSLRIPVGRSSEETVPTSHPGEKDWTAALESAACLKVPDKRIVHLYDTAVWTLVLLSAGDIVPGPFTYRRFWFRDACLMIHALLSIGCTSRCRRALWTFPDRQKKNGYFQSQNGEWDSNGQVLWIFEQFERLSGNILDERIMISLEKGARWIGKKRLPPSLDAPHAGLLPAGFSAEHLGPNDYYYWDDFWSIGGLESLTRLNRRVGRHGIAPHLHSLSEEMRESVFNSIDAIPASRRKGGIPASPYRRMDAGAVGSLVADYPLRLTPPGDPRIMATVNHLMDHCFVDGAFFQDMIHSGINAYLTLAIAQTLLRAGDDRYVDLVRRTAELASPTGQWPEAIHPATGGGCMGDGQHGWAAAEWVMMIRHLFLREEGGRLVIGSGIFKEWLKGDTRLSFGPAPTPWGKATVHIEPRSGRPRVRVDGNFSGEQPGLDIALPGFQTIVNAAPNTPHEVRP